MAGGHPLEIQMKISRITEAGPDQNLWKLNTIPQRK